MTTLLKITLDDDGKACFSSDFASLENEVSLQISFRQKAEPYGGPHPELADKLLDWRRNTARTAQVPPYFILHQKLLYAIADLKPTTREELILIPGFGERMWEKYGSEILGIVNA